MQVNDICRSVKSVRAEAEEKFVTLAAEIYCTKVWPLCVRRGLAFRADGRRFCFVAGVTEIGSKDDALARAWDDVADALGALSVPIGDGSDRAIGHLLAIDGRPRVEEVVEIEEPVSEDEDAWIRLRVGIDTARIDVLEEDVREHHIEVRLGPLFFYCGDDRAYHAFIASLVYRADVAILAETLQHEMTPESLDEIRDEGERGEDFEWRALTGSYRLDPDWEHGDYWQKHQWIAALHWVYGGLSELEFAAVYDQVAAHREDRPDQESRGWWTDDSGKLVRVAATCERDLPLGTIIGGLTLTDGAKFVEEDKARPRKIAPPDDAARSAAMPA